jgi:hypothetical protein
MEWIANIKTRMNTTTTFLSTIARCKYTDVCRNADENKTQCCTWEGKNTNGTQCERYKKLKVRYPN